MKFYPIILAAILLAGCATTVVRNKAGRVLFHDQANSATETFVWYDPGSKEYAYLERTGVDHAAPTTAGGNASFNILSGAGIAAVSAGAGFAASGVGPLIVASVAHGAPVVTAALKPVSPPTPAAQDSFAFQNGQNSFKGSFSLPTTTKASGQSGAATAQVASSSKSTAAKATPKPVAKKSTSVKSQLPFTVTVIIQKNK